MTLPDADTDTSMQLLWPQCLKVSLKKCDKCAESVEKVCGSIRYFARGVSVKSYRFADRLWLECDDPTAPQRSDFLDRSIWLQLHLSYYVTIAYLTPFISNATVFVKTITNWSSQCSFEGNWCKVNRKGSFMEFWTQQIFLCEINQNISEKSINIFLYQIVKITDKNSNRNTVLYPSKY